MNGKPIALITGASRKIGIGASIAKVLAKSGWNIAITYWQPYDDSMPWGSHPEEVDNLLLELKDLGADTFSIEADLSESDSPSMVIENTITSLGNITALILSHGYSLDSNIQTTTIESFDLHFAINARATWLLVKDFCKQFKGTFGSGRIISITSDHVAENLPYGASKGAMDRIVLAAAEENQHKGITANVINPGATDTGWMNSELETYIKDSTFLNRIGNPKDCSNLIEFLCSDKGEWINGQLLYSNGGISYK